ncbi:MAG TPA: heavy metal translocating P-type ATPase [Aliicoccus persicus]|uniref:Heavy metal translocating P-type ATPase n=1 Tax=Aliicoccus persicus TaxID=930138 RepID=A0A921DYM8_9STAP|nr:heavy metal translocating P-type ATPase [Aliicoccus persicus]
MSQQHEHGSHRIAVIFYFIGLALAIIALFTSSDYMLIKNTLFTIATIAAGYHVVVLEGVTDTIERTKANRRFTPNAHILMGLAAIGASLIGQFWEGTLLILIFAGAHFLEDYAEGRSRREISKLMDLNPTTARLLEHDGNTRIVNVSDLEIGDKLLVLNGDQVPIDGKVLSGVTSIDESSINGESIPREISAGDEVFGSTMNGTGTFTMEVTKVQTDTVFSKILQLVNQNKSNRTKVASIIQRFEPKYVNLVLIAVVLLIILPPLLSDWTWADSYYRGLVILIAASPCALAASTVSVTLSATSNLARRGVLSKGTTYISQFANINAILFDKTGTLTKGKPEVTDYQFFGVDDEQAMIDVIVAMERESNHPLATAILNAFEVNEVLDINVENQIGTGLVGVYAGHQYRIGKPTSFDAVDMEITESNERLATLGRTVVYVARDEVVVGLIAMMDLPNEDAKDMIAYFRENNIQTEMITGDSQTTGQAVADVLNIDSVSANVMPDDKSRIVGEIQDNYGVVAMVGDGVNDAPALVKADVGVAMGDGTDVAVEVSDLALMNNNLTNLVAAHKVAKRMNRVIWQNIIFAMAVVVFLVTVSFLGLTDITLSVIIHEGSTLVVILNGLRLLRGN